ncbi:MAG TPA: phosphatidylserine decarboxylase [Syntrophobacteraceae bacterium]|nr:phosphatidylserine decarboxylase [Syntrophobacteraceae bacterium]
MTSITLLPASIVVCASLYLFWRYVWFFRNPQRIIPPESNGILSPADGTVVYVKHVGPQESVINIKRGVEATLSDITREDISRPKIIIGIFMSPFNVHYNRIPVSGQIRFVHHYPASVDNVSMVSMHLRTLLRRTPFYRNSTHIIRNQRTVTKIEGKYRDKDLACYVVQIAAKRVNGIDVYIDEGHQVKAGEIFGMIRIGSQVDLVITPLESMTVKVRPGEKVKAGQTVLIG